MSDDAASALKKSPDPSAGVGEPSLPRRARQRAHPGGSQRQVRDEALRFGRWFLKSKFELMEYFVAHRREGSGAPGDEAQLEHRFLKATRHAKRVLVARALVTVLLALGVIATAVASLAKRVWIPGAFANDVTFWLDTLDRFAAVAGSVSVVLLLSRLAFDRYLELVDTTATFLAIELASSRRSAAAR